jgi:E1-E2 ATPase
VSAGTVNCDGAMHVRAEHAGSDTVVADILRLVETAQARTAPVQRVADAFAGRFAYGVMGASALTFAFWTTAGARLFPQVGLSCWDFPVGFLLLGSEELTFAFWATAAAGTFFLLGYSCWDFPIRGLGALCCLGPRGPFWASVLGFFGIQGLGTSFGSFLLVFDQTLRVPQQNGALDSSPALNLGNSGAGDSLSSWPADAPSAALCRMIYDAGRWGGAHATRVESPGRSQDPGPYTLDRPRNARLS